MRQRTKWLALSAGIVSIAVVFQNCSTSGGMLTTASGSGNSSLNASGNSNPYGFRVVGTYESPNVVSSQNNITAALIGRWLVVAESDGLALMDVSLPNAKRYTVPFGGTISASTIKFLGSIGNNQLAIGVTDGSTYLIDLSDPSQPSPLSLAGTDPELGPQLNSQLSWATKFPSFFDAIKLSGTTVDVCAQDSSGCTSLANPNYVAQESAVVSIGGRGLEIVEWSGADVQFAFYDIAASSNLLSHLSVTALTSAPQPSLAPDYTPQIQISAVGPYGADATGVFVTNLSDATNPKVSHLNVDNISQASPFVVTADGHIIVQVGQKVTVLAGALD